MEKVMVKTQREYDEAPKNKQTQIIIWDAQETITVPTSAADKDILKIEVGGTSHVIAHADADLYCYGNSVIEAFDNTHIFAFHSAKVTARDRATVSASDNASVEAWDNVAVFSSHNARVKTHDFCDTIAKDNSSVSAEDYCIVSAYDDSTVHASGNSRVPNAFDNSTVFLSGQATAKTYDYSRISASDSASVEAYCFSTVVLGGKASVKAQDNTLIITDSKLKNISVRHKSVVFDASRVSPDTFRQHLLSLASYDHFKNNTLLAATSLISCLPQTTADAIHNKLVSLGATNSEKMQTLFQSWVRDGKNDPLKKPGGQAPNKNMNRQDKRPEPER
jgi:hypothetical protein